jgi:hypothetical protein
MYLRHNIIVENTVRLLLQLRLKQEQNTNENKRFS